jgi:hypothetical protein
MRPWPALGRSATAKIVIRTRPLFFLLFTTMPLKEKCNTQTRKYVLTVGNPLQTSLLHLVSMETASEQRNDISKKH